MEVFSSLTATRTWTGRTYKNMGKNAQGDNNRRKCKGYDFSNTIQSLKFKAWEQSSINYRPEVHDLGKKTVHFHPQYHLLLYTLHTGQYKYTCLII